MRIKAYFKGNASRAKRKRGQKQRNAPPEERASPAPCTQWTPPPPQRESHTGSPATLKNQIYLKICPFWSPIFPRKHQSEQIYLYFCPFLPKICPVRLKICHDESRKGTRSSRGAYKKGHPPPSGERQVPFTPIIFRAIKVEKSSPQENTIFRTKNTEKSHLGLIGKNFGKNLWENVSG